MGPTLSKVEKIHVILGRSKQILKYSGAVQSAFKMHMCFFVRFFHSHCFFSAEIFRKRFLVLFFEKNVLFFKIVLVY